ncbi:MAG: leucine-rich repeat protein [Lachnospiraceae bacterium]|nr:leucine-rich repeat protein [Lachnospiraceae bacterium]
MLINGQQYEEKLNKCFVPDVSEDNEIPKKSVLGNQKVDIIMVPYGVKVVGDWAFAHCMSLKEIWLPDTIREFGKDVFLDDNRLEKIVVYSKEEKISDSSKIEDEKVLDDYYVYDEVAELLAIAVKCFEKSDIYNFTNLASDEWFERYDAYLTNYIAKPDEEGFNPFLAGGEEDYEDPENDIEYYAKKQREKKCGAIFERLKVYDRLSSKEENDARSEKNILAYTTYLKKNKEEAIQFILDKRQGSYDYFKIYAEHELIEEKDIPKLLESFSDEDYVECKAYLIKYKDSHFNNGNVWDMFEL